MNQKLEKVLASLKDEEYNWLNDQVQKSGAMRQLKLNYGLTDDSFAVALGISPNELREYMNAAKTFDTVFWARVRTFEMQKIEEQRELQRQQMKQISKQMKQEKTESPDYRKPKMNKIKAEA